MSQREALPGDAVVPDAEVVMDRVTTLDAGPAEVWPWLVQLGKQRAGWYLPRRVERLVPRRRRAARNIEDRWQHLAAGDVIPDWGGREATFTVVSITPPTAIVYRSTRPRRRGGDSVELSWALVLRDLGTDRCELLLRLRVNSIGGRFPRVTTAAGELFDRVTVAGMFAGLRERLATGSVERRPGERR